MKLDMIKAVDVLKLRAEGGLKTGGGAGEGKKSGTPLDPKKVKVAQEFEAIFVRKILGPMEKAAGAAGQKAGGGSYSSMIVGALADTITSGGGIGLSDSIVRAMTDMQSKIAAPKAAAEATPGANPTGKGLETERTTSK